MIRENIQSSTVIPEICEGLCVFSFGLPKEYIQSEVF